jgi:hypothetical protein
VGYFEFDLAGEGGKSCSMTRFKELKRIDAAIEHKNNAELLWALGYCRKITKNIGMNLRRKFDEPWKIQSSPLPLRADAYLDWFSIGIPEPSEVTYCVVR